MDDPALIGIHRFKRCLTAGLGRLAADLTGQFGQCLIPFFPVISHIDGHAVIRVVHPIGHQAGQILQGIEGLAAAADDKAHIVSVQRQYTALSLHLDVDGNLTGPHLPQHTPQVFRRFVRRGYLCKGLHARRTAAKKTQRLFLRHLQDFKLRRLDIQANLPCRGFLGFLKCRRFLDRFFTHGSPSFHVTGSSG